MEIWKPVVGFEELYEVSNLGNVRRKEHDGFSRNRGRHYEAREKVLGKDKDGYSTVMLYAGQDKKKLCKVHRLVAKAFIANPNGYSQVNHIDEDKANNKVENLEWCDCKYNNNYGNRNKNVSKSKMNHPCYANRDSITGRFVSADMWASRVIEAEEGKGEE